MSTSSNFCLLTNKEKEKILCDERERRRKIRLIQVREQTNEQAKKLREKVNIKKHSEMLRIRQNVKNRVKAEKEEQLENLNQQLDKSIQEMGQAHNEAILTPNLDKLRSSKLSQSRLVAMQRHKQAIKTLRNEKNKNLHQKNWLIERRKLAAQTAKARTRMTQFQLKRKLENTPSADDGEGESSVKRVSFSMINDDLV